MWSTLTKNIILILTVLNFINFIKQRDKFSINVMKTIIYCLKKF